MSKNKSNKAAKQADEIVDNSGTKPLEGPEVNPSIPSQLENQPKTFEDLKIIAFSVGVTAETFANIERTFVESLKYSSAELESFSETYKQTVKPIGVVGIGTNMLLGSYLEQGLIKHALFPGAFIGHVETLAEAIDDALQNESIADGFIVFPENVFIVSDVLLADIQSLRAKGEMKAGCGLADRTIELSAANGIKTRQISLDCPVYLEKVKIISLLEMYPDLKINEVDFISLYFNTFYPSVSALELDYRIDNVLLPIVSENPKIGAVEKYLSGKKFVFLSEKSQSSEMLGYFSKKLKVD